MTRGQKNPSTKRKVADFGWCPETGLFQWVTLLPGEQTLEMVCAVWIQKLGRFEPDKIKIGVCGHGNGHKIVLVSAAYLNRKETKDLFHEASFIPLQELMDRVEKWWKEVVGENNKQRRSTRKVLISPNKNYELGIALAT